MESVGQAESAPETPQTSSSSRSSNVPSTSSISNIKSKNKRCRENEILRKVEEQLDNQHVEDEFDIIGKNIAHKLRKLPRDTAIITEKLIMDVLFESHLGNISKDSKINVISQNRNVPQIEKGTLGGYTSQSTAFQHHHLQVAQQTSPMTQGLYQMHSQQYGRNTDNNTQSQFADPLSDSNQPSDVRSYLSAFTTL